MMAPSRHPAPARRDSGAAFAAPRHRSLSAPLGPPPLRCQWIAETPGYDDSCKCGRPVAPGYPWCAAHLARAHEPPSTALCVWRLVFGQHPRACANAGARCAACGPPRRPAP